MLAAAVAAYFIGRITLRLRGAYFVLASLGFAEVLRIVVLNWVDVTGGPMGFPGIPRPGFELPLLGKVVLASKLANYFLFWALVAIALFVIWRVIDSRLGRALVAISESEPLAESIGISIYKYTLGVLLFSAAIIGLAGALYAHYITFISPDMFYIGNTITMLVMVVVGGRRTFGGPILGAVLFTILPELLRAVDMYRMIVYGAVIIAAILYFPRGVTPALGGLLKRCGWGGKSRGLPGRS